MKQRFFWFIICGMFFCVLGFLFAGLGLWILTRSFANPVPAAQYNLIAAAQYRELVQPPAAFCGGMCLLMEFVGVVFIFLGIVSIPKDVT